MSTTVELRGAAFIRDCIARWGGPGPSRYVGVTGDPQHRLFGDHGVVREVDLWAFADCGTATTARAEESRLLRLGCRGGPGGGDQTARYLYVYRITGHTVQ